MISQQLWSSDRAAYPPDRLRPPSRTDVVCAATSLFYGNPLYTTDPSRYELLGRSVNTVEYGPDRGGVQPTESRW